MALVQLARCRRRPRRRVPRPRPRSRPERRSSPRGERTGDPPAVGEIVDLETLDQPGDFGLVREEGRDDDERSESGRDALLQFELRQGARLDDMRHVPVGDGDGQVRRRNEGKQRHQPDREGGRARDRRDHDRAGEDDGGQEDHRPDVSGSGMAQPRALQPEPDRSAVVELLLERRSPLRHQEVAGVRQPRTRRPCREDPPPLSRPGAPRGARPRLRRSGCLWPAPRRRADTRRGWRSPSRRRACRRGAPPRRG